MTVIYDDKAAKKSVNLTVNSDLIDKAKKIKINLSATFEKALAESVKEKEREHWMQANKEAIKKYNKHVEKNGVFSKGTKSF